MSEIQPLPGEIIMALVGYPLSHSLSPVIQMEALRSVQLTGTYQLIPIYPTDFAIKIIELKRDVREGFLTGFNVTIPYKQKILSICDSLSDSARKIGAVNLICRDGLCLVGDNCDADGFLAAIPSNLQQNSGQTAIILGAGGAARACVYALANIGWNVYVVARRIEQGLELAHDFKDLIGYVQAVPMSELENLSLQSIQLVVNATSAGMFPKTEESSWPVELKFPSNAVIYDLVYNPMDTLFLKKAQQSGHQTIDGLTMLIEQATISFKRWTGRDPDKTAMRNSALSRLMQS